MKFGSSPNYDDWDFNKLIWMYERVIKQQDENTDSDKLLSSLRGSF